MNYRSNARVVADTRRDMDEYQARVDGFLVANGCLLRHPHRDARDFLGASLREHVQALAEARGEDVPSGLNQLMAGEVRAYERRLATGGQRSGMGTADLPAFMETAIKRAALAGWERTPTSYQHWTRTGTVRTFEREGRVGLSEVGLLPEVPPGSDIPLMKAQARTEYVRATTRAGRIRFTRAMLFGDDSGALVRLAEAFGQAEQRTVQAAVTDYLTQASGTGPTLNQDSTALFHTNHNNYVSSSGAAPGLATVNAARQKMRRQKAPGSTHPLNIYPSILLVPAALEETARVLVAAGRTAWDDDEGDLRVVVDPGLDDVSATAWYLIADPERFDTVEVAFLEGRVGPRVEMQEIFHVDGGEWRLTTDFGIGVRDFRTMFRNVGA
jgi:hypothetical protein